MLKVAAAATRLEACVLPLTRAHPHESGVLPLADGRDAFAARALLADAADRTLDVQYYIWHGDMSGMLLFDALRRAADRGVRVRLLLDDNNTSGLDAILAALNAHPDIEVRLFNPFRHRRWRALDYLTDFRTMNRRMHNKTFTVDNQVTIVGGRNVGDEYFGAGQGALFMDLDVLAIGPVVEDVARDFERYWTCDSAHPVSRVLPAVNPAQLADVEAAALTVARDPASTAYVEALVRQPFVRDLLARELQFEWAPTMMVSDDPKKGLGRAETGALLWTRLKELFGAPNSELQLISPYFVPGQRGVDYFATLARQGVSIRVLTNSFEATDVAVVHAGYAKRRKPLIMAGVSLCEIKRSAMTSGTDRKLTTGSGSSSSSLHAKVFAVDRSRVFVGSFNFDPRSARLNTEMGVVIDSPQLAQAIADRWALNVPIAAYVVRVSDGGRLHWLEQREGGAVQHAQEPGTDFWKRLSVSFLGLLPIEWLL